MRVEQAHFVSSDLESALKGTYLATIPCAKDQHRRKNWPAVNNLLNQTSVISQGLFMRDHLNSKDAMIGTPDDGNIPKQANILEEEEIKMECE